MDPTEEQLYRRIAEIFERARSQVARTIDTAMVPAYWDIGREIVQVEQGGIERAAYGQRLIEGLAVRLRPASGAASGSPRCAGHERFI